MTRVSVSTISISSAKTPSVPRAGIATSSVPKWRPPTSSGARRRSMFAPARRRSSFVVIERERTLPRLAALRRLLQPRRVGRGPLWFQVPRRSAGILRGDKKERRGTRGRTMGVLTGQPALLRRSAGRREHRVGPGLTLRAFDPEAFRSFRGWWNLVGAIATELRT